MINEGPLQTINMRYINEIILTLEESLSPVTCVFVIERRGRLGHCFTVLQKARMAAVHCF